MKKITCLLIDDDADDRELFGMALEDMKGNIEYISTENCHDAIHISQAEEPIIPDYIFLDLNMPYHDGKECLQELKKMEHLEETPVIIYTTSSFEKDIEDTKNLGASHYFTKTPHFEELIKVLTSLFQKDRLPFLLNLDAKGY